MPTLTLELPSAGQKILAGLHATNYADIQALLNGNLDGSNINQASVFALGGSGITLGADVNLYRSAANILKTDDQLFVGSGLISLGTAVTSAVQSPSIHSDGTNVYHGLDNGAFFFRPMGASFNGSMLRLMKGAGGGGAHLTLYGEGGEGDVNLYRLSADNLRTDDTFTAATIVVVGEIYNDSASWFIADGGVHEWGPGNWTRDTNLYRASANILATDSGFRVAGDIHLNTDVGRIYFGASADNNLYRYDANGLAVSGAFSAMGGLCVDRGTAGAYLFFGGALDTALSRTAANQLEMASGDTFKVSNAGLKFSDNTIQTTAATSTGPDPATTLPGSPVDGQVAILTDSTTAPTYQWKFQYDTSISGSYKWRFIGGSAYRVNGLSLTVPRAGNYHVEIGALGRLYNGNEYQSLTITAGGISLVAQAGANGGGTQTIAGSTYDSGIMNALTASQVLTLTNSGNITASNPYIRITPILVS